MKIIFLHPAYEAAYGDSPVWKTYGRNYKGHWDPETRKTCVVCYFITVFI